jgi:DNA-binding SARP family transcriptional activator/tetratricopeptide (TPR) repeat protein
MTGAPARTSASMRSLQVRLLGGLSVVRDGVLLRDTELANRRGRVLLKMLAAEHGRRISLDRIVNALWAEQRPPRAAENVAVLVSRLRRVIGPDSIRGNREGYVLADDGVRVDITEAEQFIAEAESRLASAQAGLAGTAAARALELLDGGLPVPEEDADWSVALRARATDLHARARHATADAGLQLGDVRTAREAAEAALRDDQLDEVAARQLMLCHVRAGEPGRGLAVFTALQETLASALGTDPAPETRELHLRILREQPVEPPVAGRRPVVGRADSGSELVGRAEEVTSLVAAWTAAVESRPSLLLVTGEAGIGKTRLVEELAAIAERTGGLVLRARCYDTERSLFLQPVVDALTPTVARLSMDGLRRVGAGRSVTLATLFPQSGPLLEPIVQERGSPETERRQAYETVSALLRFLALERPVLLFLDDAHLAGLATIEVLHYLPRHLSNARVLLVATLRSEEGAEIQRRLAPVADTLETGTLAAAAVEELARRAGLVEQAAGIMSRTQGHALFVVETIRALSTGDAGVPASLREVIVQRVARIGQEAEDLLRAAAVIGTSFEPDIVGGLLHLDGTEAARRCEHLLSSRLVVAAGRSYEFVHDLVHEVVYTSIPEPTRFAYHRAAADLLADRPEAAGWHASAVGDWPRAARALMLAAQQAADRYAAADADRLLGRALEAAERASDIDLCARAYAARGRVRETLAAYHDAERDLWAANRLAREGGDRHLQMRVLRQLGGDVTVSLGHPVRVCEQLLEDALALAGELGDRRAEADVLARLSVLACNRLRFEESTTLAARGLTAARAAGDEHTTAVALDGVKTTLAYLGDVDALIEVVELLEPMLRREGNILLLQWTVFESAFIPFARGDWTSATQRMQDALELNRRSGFGAYRGWFDAHLGWLARLQGRHDEAEQLGRRALSGTSALPHAWWNTFARAMLASTLADAGETGEAVLLLEDGLRLADRGGTPAYRLRCLALLAQLTGYPPMLAEADALLAAVSTPPGRAWLHGVDVYVAVAQAHLDRGAVDAAAHVIDRLSVAARVCGNLPALAQARLVQAQCAILRGDDPSSDDALTEAETLAATLSMPHLHARTVALRKG